ncbi:Ileal sodium/bile acid cotransporter [Nymphon striatum]|nr:Ileal sodium/bile acid cotransporter [Nymphon striatum]
MELNSSSNRSFNGTSEEQFETPVLKTVLDVVLIIIVVFIMISMGCTITKEEIWKHIKTPISAVIGMVSQFVLLPLCSYGMSYALGLTTNIAIGMLVLSCCPGGAMSNLFTYWFGGDVSLSITMTTFSTLLAFGMMPLNLLIYSSGWTSEDVVIPYLKIFITLLTILGPVFIGMLLKEFLPKFASIFCKIGSVVGLLAIAIFLIIQSVLFPGIYLVKWNVWVAAAIFPIIGFVLGFILAKLAQREMKVCKAISFETGSQNVPLALTVLFLTFPFDVLEEATAFPQLYAVIMLIEYGGFVIVYNIHLKFFSSQKDKDSKSVKVEPSEDKVQMTQINKTKEPENGIEGPHSSC